KKCGRAFIIPPSWAKFRTHCSKECQKRRVTYICEGCGNMKEERPSCTRQRFCSNRCRLKWFSTNFTGARSPHFAGGRPGYYGPSWKRQAAAVRQRDNYTCQRCKTPQRAENRSLDVAHKI